MTGESPGDLTRPHTHTHKSTTDPSSTSTASRDAVSTAPVARAHEAEPETIGRQFVRWVYSDPSYEQMPHQPASLSPKRRKPEPVPPVNRVLYALSAVGCEYRPARSVDEWEAQCPTHDDSRPSLVVRRNPDGSVWIKCWSGACSKEGILHALGLQWRDLWDGSERDSGRAGGHVKPLLPAHLRRAMEDLLRRDDERRAA